MKSLVVTADDVGLHPAMTAGALRAHDQGIVTTVSVAAVGADLARATAAIRSRPALECGVHLVLVGERPLSPAAEVPTLVGTSGRLLSGFRSFTWRYLRGGISPGEVERELRRQIEAVLAAGLRPLHLNAHQHLHVLPGVQRVVRGLAAEYGVPWLRDPIDDAASGLSPRSLQLRVLSRLGRSALRLRTGSLATRSLGRSAGLWHAGHLNVERLLAIVSSIDASTELVCHPGSDDAALRKTYDWGYRWEAETAALCDPRVRAALDDAGIALSGFGAL